MPVTSHINVNPPLPFVDILGFHFFTLFYLPISEASVRLVIYSWLNNKLKNARFVESAGDCR